MKDEEAPPSVTFATGGLSWTRVRTPRNVSIAAKALLFASGLLLAATPYANPSTAILGIGAALVAAPLLLVSYVLSMTVTRSKGTLEILPQYVAVRTDAGVRVVATSAIVGALVVDHVRGTRGVDIELSCGDRLTAQIGDPAGAERVVEALGFARGRRVSTTLTRPSARLLHLPFAVLASLVASAVTVPLSAIAGPLHWWTVFCIMWPALSLALYELARRALRGPTVTVGDDGVRVERGWRSRSLPLDGELDAEIRGSFLDVERKSAIVRLAAERARSPAATPERAAVVERGGKPLAEWRAHLARAFDGASYRGAPLTRDEAFAILRSPSATAEQRVGAALALRVAGEEEKLRVARDALTDDRVRVALEAVAEDDDPALESALKRLA